MSFHSLWLKFAALLLAALVGGCGGGSSAPPPVGGIKVEPGDGQVTITWTPAKDVQYWLFYAPGTRISTDELFTTPNHVDVLNVTSPYVVSGLANGVSYAFTINGRFDGGPGGAQTPSVAVVPRPAGSVWQVGTAAGLGSGDLRGITYGLASDSVQRYLTVGAGGAMYHSPDGLTWTAVAGAGRPELYAAAYAYANFYAVGDAGSVLYGPSLSTWTTATSVTTARLNAIAFNGARLVAVGDNGTVITSTDGLAWTAVASVPSSANLYGVAFSGAGLWMAVGAAGTVLTSADGLTWTAATSNTKANLRALAVQYVLSYTYTAVGDGGTILTSIDGVTWTAQTLSPTSDLRAVTASYSQFVAVGASGVVWTSPTGATWTRQTSNTTADLLALNYVQAQLLAVGKGGASVYSK
jgi:hypothetical protein